MEQCQSTMQSDFQQQKSTIEQQHHSIAKHAMIINQLRDDLKQLNEKKLTLNDSLLSQMEYGNKITKNNTIQLSSDHEESHSQSYESSQFESLNIIRRNNKRDDAKALQPQVNEPDKPKDGKVDKLDDAKAHNSKDNKAGQLQDAKAPQPQDAKGDRPNNAKAYPLDDFKADKLDDVKADKPNDAKADKPNDGNVAQQKDGMAAKPKNAKANKLKDQEQQQNQEQLQQQQQQKIITKNQLNIASSTHATQDLIEPPSQNLGQTSNQDPIEVASQDAIQPQNQDPNTTSQDQTSFQQNSNNQLKFKIVNNKQTRKNVEKFTYDQKSMPSPKKQKKK